LIAISEHERKTKLIDEQNKSIQRLEAHLQQVEHDLDTSRRESNGIRFENAQLRSKLTDLQNSAASTGLSGSEMQSSQPEVIINPLDSHSPVFTDNRYDARFQARDKSSAEEENNLILDFTPDILSKSKVKIPLSIDHPPSIDHLSTIKYPAPLETKPEVKLDPGSSPGSSDGSDSLTSASNNDTDWDEDEIADSLHKLRASTLPQASQPPQSSSIEHLVKPILSPMKRELVDRMMNEFWAVFNQDNDLHR
jgi:hypothetical protein